jgi:hypothetical protein
MAYQSNAEVRVINEKRKKKQSIGLPFIIHYSSFIISLWRCNFLTTVTAEHPGRSKLTELVTDHVFLTVNTQKLIPVVNLKRMTNKLGNDRAGARPGLERLLRTVLIQLQHLLVQLLVDERAFFCASAHDAFPLTN